MNAEERKSNHSAKSQTSWRSTELYSANNLPTIAKTCSLSVVWAVWVGRIVNKSVSSNLLVHWPPDPKQRLEQKYYSEVYSFTGAVSSGTFTATQNRRERTHQLYTRYRKTNQHCEHTSNDTTPYSHRTPNHIMSHDVSFFFLNERFSLA